MAYLNTLFIKAIKEFNRKFPRECEIRSIAPLEASGKGTRYSSATFSISYVYMNCSLKTEISVEA